MKRKFTLKSTLLIISSLCFFSCESIENVGKNTGIFQPLSSLATWSMVWIIPALFIYCLFIIDKKDTKTLGNTAYGSSHDGQTYEFNVSKNKTIKGNSVIAEISMFFWLLLYPLFCLYWPFFKNSQKITLFGYSDLDWFFIKILVPLIIIIGSVTLSRFLSKSEKKIAKIFKYFLFSTLTLSILNLCVWGIIVLMK